MMLEVVVIKGKRHYRCSSCGDLYDSPDEARECRLNDRSLMEVATDEAEMWERGARLAQQADFERSLYETED